MERKIASFAGFSHQLAKTQYDAQLCAPSLRRQEGMKELWKYVDPTVTQCIEDTILICF